MKFKKSITRGKLLPFKSAIDTSRSRTRSIQFIIYIFIKKVFLFQFTYETLQWSFTFQGWVFIGPLEFRCVWNYFLNSVIVRFSIEYGNSISFIGFGYNDIFNFSKVLWDTMLTKYTWRRFVVVEIREMRDMRDAFLYDF